MVLIMRMRMFMRGMLMHDGVDADAADAADAAHDDEYDDDAVFKLIDDERGNVHDDCRRVIAYLGAREVDAASTCNGVDAADVVDAKL